MKKKNLSFLIGGPAGSGIEKSGQLLAMSFVRGGYYVLSNIEHSSQIRGGNNFLRLRIDEIQHEVHVEEIDVMIALDKQTIDEHLHEVVNGGVVIYDDEVVKLEEKTLKHPSGCKQVQGDTKMLNVPLRKLATEEVGNAITENVISLGVVLGLVGFDINGLKQVLGKIFGNKSAEIIKANEKAADIGFEIGKKSETDFHVELLKKKSLNNMFLAGNDALCVGAIKAGCKFVGEYPMTPSSSVLHFMARWADKYGVVVKHTEDEIAAVNSLIGAGFVGVRSIAATSGGGFALMTEGIGLASMNEVPIVVVNVMRPGPATGLPTRTEAGDLRQMIHAGQGDPVKIVLLPGSPQECFDMGFLAFNLAEKYQIPVIIGYDKYLGEGYYTVPEFKTDDLKIDRGKIVSEKELTKGDFKRYLRTSDGISPRSLPGMKGGIHRATSDEHNEYGEICEDAENRNLMVEKRARKMDIALDDLPKPLLIGDKNADITFVTWTSCKSACIEACELLSAKKIKANVLQIRTAWPFHKKETLEILKKLKRPIIVEQNHDAQMAGLIAEQTGIILNEKILKYDGRPMTVKFIIDNLK